MSADDFRSFRLGPSIPRTRDTNPTRMFKLLLPAGLCMTILVPPFIVGVNYWEPGPMDGCMFFLLVPIAIGYLALAIVEAIKKPKGLSAFLQGAAWNLIMVVSLWVLLVKLSRHPSG